ncbi:hypothetical protein KIMH_05160 [Bombiscardovia apis]|uniref:Uncharacterized protein n=2 Tax=Bombiscardovia apis TaxID=2932182 RepID=A0ABM8BBW6_9BIFI|nr:hypothetical protein KIMH_05160 [Bombiscardovia apis]
MRAVTIAQQKGYWAVLILGILLIIGMIGFCYYLFKNRSYSQNSITVLATYFIINAVLFVVLVLVFWDPIFTTFCTLIGASLAVLYTMES